MAFVGDHTLNSLETGTEFVINQVINNFTFVYYFWLIAKRKITCVVLKNWTRKSFGNVYWR